MRDCDRLKLALCFFSSGAIRLPTVCTIGGKHGGLINLVVKVDPFPYRELECKCFWEGHVTLGLMQEA